MYREFLNHLNGNSGAYITLLTVVLTIATAAYAWLTWRLLREAMRVRELQHQPEMVASLEGRGNFNSKLYLRLRNIGTGTAFDVRLSIHPDMALFKRHLSEMGEFKNGIPYVRAGGSWSIYLTSLHSSETREQAKTDFAITIDYRHAERTSQQRIYRLGTLTAAAEFYGAEPDSLESIRQELEYLRQHFERDNSMERYAPRFVSKQSNLVATGFPSHSAGATEIARLAYAFWEARGRTEGAQEEDWFRAERYLRARGSPDS